MLQYPTSPLNAHLTDWWHQRHRELIALAQKGTPRYVYSAAVLRRQARALLQTGVFGRVLYAMKANPHPGVLRTMQEEGLGFECVSPAEIKRILEICPGVDRQKLLFTPNFVPREEYA